MAKIDLKKFSLVELEQLKIDLDQALETRRHEERGVLKQKMAEMATKAGFSIDELFEGGNGKKAPLPPKYRNPDNQTQTWSGRGRKPNWLEERIKAGEKQEHFLIK